MEWHEADWIGEIVVYPIYKPGNDEEYDDYDDRKKGRPQWEI